MLRRLLPAVLCGSMLLAFHAAEDAPVSNLKSDERIVFFTTDARRGDGARSWRVPVHAWVHERKDTRVRKAVFAASLQKKYGLKVTAETESNFNRRVRLFVVDNEGGKDLVVRFGEQTFSLPETGSNGHAKTEIELNDAVVSSLPRDGRGRIEFTAVLRDGDERIFKGSVNLVDPRGVSVISDIDDTVKVTGVTDRAEMFDRTFFRDFEPAPGMAALYDRWAHQGATFHYVSSSPWHLYEPLDDFLTRCSFPPRTLSLKLVRLKDRTIMDLFRQGTETKPRQIEPILERFPERRFVLVGDSGEQDPEVYGALMREYPGRIERVYIRNVNGAAADDERFAAAFAGIEPERWSLFTDPAGLELPR